MLEIKNKVVLEKIVLIILILIVYIVAYIQYSGYRYEKNKYENKKNYNQYQRLCVQVGTTFNYIYVIRKDDKNQVVCGAKYIITDESEKIVAEFTTNQKGEGGVVGLENGVYYIQETEVPEGCAEKDEKYKFIYNNNNTEYFLYIIPEQENTGESKEEGE